MNVLSTCELWVTRCCWMSAIKDKIISCVMDKQKSETQKSEQRLFHFDERNIEQICASLENGMHWLKIIIGNLINL